jgi:alpha-beta hydrolase superfamily lysophospholipase
LPKWGTNSSSGGNSKKINSDIKLVPQSILRDATILNDIYLTYIAKNKAYIEHSYKDYKKNGHYPEYAQIGAVRFPNFKKTAEMIERAPKLDESAGDITQPILMFYGGEDNLNGIKNSEIPQRYQEMFDSMKSRENELIVVHGADHPLNTKTQADDCFNSDPKFSYVKQKIVEHFKAL